MQNNTDPFEQDIDVPYSDLKDAPQQPELTPYRTKSDKELKIFTQDLFERSNSFSETESEIIHPEHIPHQGPLIYRGFPENYRETDFYILWRAGIRKEVVDYFTELRSTLQHDQRAGFRLAEKHIGWDIIVSGITALLSQEGLYWDKPARQKFLKQFGWWVLKLAQVTEIFYTIGGIVLSFFKVSFRDPVFWLGIIPTLISSLGTLVMNVSLVNPDEEVAEVISPDNFVMDYKHFETKHEIKFLKPLIKKDELGFKNEFAAEFFNRCLGPLATNQPAGTVPWYLKPLQLLTILINEICFHLNNSISPAGNWLAIAFAVSLTNVDAWTKIKVGIPTFLFVEAVDAGYYVALSRGPKNKANRVTWSKSNPAVQAALIDPVQAFLAFIEYLLNAILRGLTVSGSVGATLTYLALADLLDQDFLETFQDDATLIVFIVIALNTAFTRHRAFNDILKPCTFKLPYGQEVTLTTARALDYLNVRSIVREEFSANDMSSLMFNAVRYGVYYSVFSGIVFFKKLEMKWAIVATSGVQILFTILDYYRSKRNLINQRARNVLDFLCETISHDTSSSQLLSLVFWVVFYDGISRAISRIGGMRGIPFINDLLGLENLPMFIACAAITIPAALPEMAFFRKLMKKNGPKLIEFVQKSVEDTQENKTIGCWSRTYQRLNQANAYLMTLLMPAWFKKSEDISSCSNNTMMSFILPCCFRRKKTSSPDMKKINAVSATSEVASVTIFSESNRRHNNGIREALRQVKTVERQEMCLVM